MNKIQELATAIHDLCCASNHIDQCGWGHGEGTWSHKYYTEIANDLAKQVGYLHALTVIKILKGVCR